MNTYIFDLEFQDGDTMAYKTYGANLFMAKEMLIEYLKNGGIDPHDVTITNFEVIVYEKDGNEQA